LNGSGIDGLFPRTSDQLAALDTYSDILRDWCLQTDPICTANQSNGFTAAHLSYYNIYPDAAAEWIKSVASLTATSPFVTTIPNSLSGIVQDYATPSGTVTIETTWTNFPSIAACTSVSSASSSSTSSSSYPSSSSSSSADLSSSGPNLITRTASSSSSISTSQSKSTVSPSMTASPTVAAQSTSSSTIPTTTSKHNICGYSQYLCIIM
jgi:hypothetical protein